MYSSVRTRQHRMTEAARLMVMFLTSGCHVNDAKDSNVMRRKWWAKKDGRLNIASWELIIVRIGWWWLLRASHEWLHDSWHWPCILVVASDAILFASFGIQQNHLMAFGIGSFLEVYSSNYMNAKHLQPLQNGKAFHLYSCISINFKWLRQRFWLAVDGPNAEITA